MSDELAAYLEPAPAIACDDEIVVAMARDLIAGSKDDIEAAIILFEFVRDGIRYNPYVPFWDLSFYTAEATLKRGKGYCVQKSALLVTLARAVGIPARLGFGDIANHLLPDGLYDYLGTNVMTFHCWAELFLAGKWVKATPSFEEALCTERGWRLVVFDGRNDAMLPATDLEGRPHVSYLKTHFTSPGVALDDLLAAWEEVYTPQRLALWRKALAKEYGIGD